MISKEQNDQLIQTGAGTPCGDLMRQFWQPAALAEELRSDRPVKAVKLFDEDLVLFRNEEGEVGLISRSCPHRGADLCFGRLEDGGLRCSFHGWLFDKDGRCLEQPAEPENSKFYSKIKIRSYPCREVNGIIFTYMGVGEPPEFPNFDFCAAPEGHTFAFKGLVEANWLQVLEVGIDPAHASYLHRYFEDDDPGEGYGQQFRDTSSGADIPITKVLREFGRPEIELEETEIGLRIFALRYINEKWVHVRVSNLMFPNAIIIPMSGDMIITQWHVPIDDASSYWYAIFSSFSEPVDKEAMREQRLALYSTPDYAPRLNRQNNWGFDPENQKTKTFTGMGDDINVHDQWAVESPGAIYDRTTEHLGATDKAIAAYRKILRRTIEDESFSFLQSSGNPHYIYEKKFGPLAVDTIAPRDEWVEFTASVDATRRKESPWAFETNAELIAPFSKNSQS